MSQLVTVDHFDSVATLTLNRQDSANALSIALISELSKELKGLRDEGECRVLVITGQGAKAFCAGADLKERATMNEDEVRSAVASIRELTDIVASMPMPVIAQIGGAAFGGGLEIALACDLRIASDNAVFALSETSLAIIPGAGGTQRLPRIVGVAKAKELILTARKVTAEEAFEMGLIHRLTTREDLSSETLKWARAIADNGPIAVRQAKCAIDRGMDTTLTEGLRIEAALYEAVIPTADRQEGLAAFRERRKPHYFGR